MLPIGSFLVFGTELAPQVHLLGETSHKAFQQGSSVVRTPKGRTQLYSETFAQGAEAAIPAWSEQAMLAIAEGYSGPYSAEIRGIAAAIALGVPFSKDGDGDHGSDGGTPALLIPEPKGPYSGGSGVIPTKQEISA